MGDDVPSFLTAHGLDVFATPFADLGYDSVAVLRALDSEEINTLIAYIRVTYSEPCSDCPPYTAIQPRRVVPPA